jgi:hypothetical protein
LVTETAWLLATFAAACIAPRANPGPGIPTSTPTQPPDFPYAAPSAPVTTTGETACSADGPAPAHLDSGYDLAGLWIFSRTLFYVRENHPRDVAPIARELLVKSLEAVAAREREIQVDRDLATPPRWATVTVAGKSCTLNLERVDAPWSLRSRMQEAMRFVDAHLPPPPWGRGVEREMAIEIAATNGMLAALDGHSRLLDADAYAALRARRPKRSGTAAAEPDAPRSESAIDASGPTPTPMRVLPRAAPGSRVAGLRLREFAPGVSAEVERALASLEREPPAGIVIDLRDNKGGVFDEAVKVADAFIKEGILVSTTTKRGRNDRVAHSDGHEPGGAIVVLVNRRTASGAEIVAAALKNLGRGVVLGEPTAGLASIDVVFELPPTRRRPGEPDDESLESLGLLLSLGRALAPGGAEIAGAGVTPDIQLSPVTEALRAENDCLLQFADALINQAPDPRRATLLSTARTLAPPAACKTVTPARP